MPKATKKVFIKTLGCDKNTVDSQMMLASLKNAHYKITTVPIDADVIIINTCCFIEDAKEESIDTIFSYLPYKKDGHCQMFIVAGCMAQRYADELKESLPEVDYFLGVNNLEDLLQMVDGTMEQEQMTESESMTYKEAKENRFVDDGAVTAYLKISEGCDKHCTYCAIPAIRGHYRSRQPEAIIKEAQQLRDAGVQELILIAQDLTQYGNDLEQDVNLASLLTQLSESVDFQWIRMLYLYPEGINEELVEVVRTHDSICNYFDMPIQHTEDIILKRMGRHIDKQTIYDTVKMIRKHIPDVILRTTIIAGFPGETQECFDSMLTALEELSFERLGAFAYSQEEGTPAATMPNQIDADEKEERRRLIYEQQEKITADANGEVVGQRRKVLVEEKDEDGVCLGRTYGDAPEIDCGVIIEDSTLDVGQYYEIKVVQSLDFDLIGERV